MVPHEPSEKGSHPIRELAALAHVGIILVAPEHSV
jgi:hypothetical protein